MTFAERLQVINDKIDKVANNPKVKKVERFVGNPFRSTRRGKPDDTSFFGQTLGSESAYDVSRAYRDLFTGIVLVNIPTGVTQAIGLGLILKGTAQGVRGMFEVSPQTKK